MKYFIKKSFTNPQTYLGKTVCNTLDEAKQLYFEHKQTNIACGPVAKIYAYPESIYEKTLMDLRNRSLIEFYHNSNNIAATLETIEATLKDMQDLGLLDDIYDKH